MIQTLLHILLVLTLPPLLLGIINKTKAFFAGRVGPSWFQAYFDIYKGLQKRMVVSHTTTWIFLAGPVVSLSAILTASMIVPLGHHAAPISFVGDLVLMAYLFGLSRFFTTAAALDTGSPFEGMGAAREATFSCLTEPALFFGFLVMVKLTGSLQLSTMFSSAMPAGQSVAMAALILVAVSWLIVLLAENSRIPFDDPNTHLELTMIHEVMVLDHSGPALALIEYGAALKLFVIGALLLNIAIPISAGSGLNWIVFLAGLAALAVFIGIIESVMARLRLITVPKLLVSACLLSAFGVFLLLGIN